MTQRGRRRGKKGEGRQKGGNRHGQSKRRAGVTDRAGDNMAESESGLIGHRYLEECKVGLDSAGYLQTERYYTLLIG